MGRERGIRGGVVLLFAVIVHGGCGGGRSVDESEPDGGRPAQQVLGSVVTGTRLLKGKLDVFGITTDDFAAVLDSNGGALAVPISGGPAQPIDPTADMAAVTGPVIYSFHGVDPTSTFGELTIWTAANGAIPFASGATWPVAVSDDGTRVLATAATASDGTQTNLVLGGTDGASPTTLFAVGLGLGCQPSMQFAGGRFVVSACPPGSSEATISSIDPADGTTITLLTEAQNQVTVIPFAQIVALIDRDGTAYAADVAGSHPQVIGQSVTQIVCSPDGSALFLASQGTVSVVPLNGGAAGALPPANVISLWEASPDGQSLLFQPKAGVVGPLSGGGLWVTSTTSGGPARQLSSENDAFTSPDTPFTADSQWALWFADPGPYGAGRLMAGAVSGGPTSVLGRRAVTVAAAGGARVLFTDTYTMAPGHVGRAVLRAADLSTGDPPTVMATEVGPSFYLTHAHHQVVFSFDDGTDQAGIYLAPLH